MARLHVAELGWRIDEVVGDLWSDGKAAALREHGVELFVGDHEGDVRARGHDRALRCRRLHTAGADFVLDELTEFRGLLAAR